MFHYILENNVHWWIVDSSDATPAKFAKLRQNSSAM